jgi:hypothetical protein
VLAAVGLTWHPSCAREFGQRTKASRGSSFTAARMMQGAEIERVIDETPGLAALMREFGYTAPATFEIEQEPPGQSGVRALARRLRKAIKRSLRPRPSSAEPAVRRAKLPDARA